MSLRNPIGAGVDVINIGDDLNKANPADLRHIAQGAWDMTQGIQKNDVGQALHGLIEAGTGVMNIPNLWDDLKQLHDDC
ncbi:MAG TPA: hypothetical protein V6C81_11300 [Planktothrix sp.]